MLRDVIQSAWHQSVGLSSSSNGDILGMTIITLANCFQNITNCNDARRVAETEGNTRSHSVSSSPFVPRRKHME